MNLTTLLVNTELQAGHYCHSIPSIIIVNTSVINDDLVKRLEISVAASLENGKPTNNYNKPAFEATDGVVLTPKPENTQRINRELEAGFRLDELFPDMPLYSANELINDSDLQDRVDKFLQYQKR